ncbi:MAG: PA2778 family cysteine peptidase [Pseudomonadales bacterium]|nr:PA2778 family cysteine peptidase [Pseudomonadales bacterium]
MLGSIRSLGFGLGLMLLLAACSSAPQAVQLARQQALTLPESTLLADLPFFPQDRYQCGPAALATLLNHRGIAVSPGQLVDRVYTPALEGSLQAEMKAAIRSEQLLPYQLNPELLAVMAEIEAGNPVLVLQNLGLRALPQWHYAVIKGFDQEQGEFILNSGEIENYRLSFKTFERTWQRSGHWAVLAMQPGQLPTSANSRDYFNTVAELENTGADFDVLHNAYQAGLQRWPENRELLMALANLLLGDGQYQLASHYYQRLLQHYPDYGPAHNNLAMAFLRNDKLDRADQAIRQALAIDDAFTETYRKTHHQIIQARQ